jgi:hypothetical protein
MLPPSSVPSTVTVRKGGLQQTHRFHGSLLLSAGIASAKGQIRQNVPPGGDFRQQQEASIEI